MELLPVAGCSLMTPYHLESTCLFKSFSLHWSSALMPLTSVSVAVSSSSHMRLLWAPLCLSLLLTLLRRMLRNEPWPYMMSNYHSGRGMLTMYVVPINRVQHLLQHLNTIESTIQFTVEVENDGKLPFLDVNISRLPDGSFNTSVFIKPTHTDRYLDFASHHPISHKRAVVSTLTSRASTHSSQHHDKITEMSNIVSSPLFTPLEDLLLVLLHLHLNGELWLFNEYLNA